MNTFYFKRKMNATLNKNKIPERVLMTNDTTKTVLTKISLVIAKVSAESGDSSVFNDNVSLTERWVAREFSCNSSKRNCDKFYYLPVTNVQRLKKAWYCQS